MIRRLVVLLAFGSLLVLAAHGCAGDGSELVDDMIGGGDDGGGVDPCLDPLEPTLATLQTNTFSPKCGLGPCHAPGGFGPMPLHTVEATFDSLVDVESIGVPALLRVEPGNPDDSYVIWKLEGNPDIVGQQMPLGGLPLPQEEIDEIRAWIENGACPS